MSIDTGSAFTEKKLPYTYIDVKFSAETISTVRIYIYISIYTSKSLFFCLFSISWLHLNFYPYSEFRFGFYGKFYMIYRVLKIFFILLFRRIKIGKMAENDVKFCFKNRFFLRFLILICIERKIF